MSTCPKCGAYRMSSPVYCAGNGACGVPGCSAEHLTPQCRCGYTEKSPTLDQKAPRTNEPVRTHAQRVAEAEFVVGSVSAIVGALEARDREIEMLRNRVGWEVAERNRERVAVDVEHVAQAERVYHAWSTGGPDGPTMPELIARALAAVTAHAEEEAERRDARLRAHYAEQVKLGDPKACWDDIVEAAEVQGIRKAVTVNGSTPFPLLDVLRILCDVADHTLDTHSCDHHGYEVWSEARHAGRECIRELTRLAPEGGPLEASLDASEDAPLGAASIDHVVLEVRRLYERLAAVEARQPPPGWEVNNYSCTARPDQTLCRNSATGHWSVWSTNSALVLGAGATAAEAAAAAEAIRNTPRGTPT